MPSVWIERRTIAGARNRYLVKYRLGGRESAHRYAGSFATRREALTRQRWVAGELAAMRVPNLSPFDRPLAAMPTIAEAAERWRASRVDVADGTAVGHRVQLARVLPLLGARRVDEVTPPTSPSSSPRCTRQAESAKRSGRASPSSRRYSTSPASRTIRLAIACTCGCRGRNAKSHPRPRPTRSRPSYGSCRAATHSRSSCSTRPGCASASSRRRACATATSTSRTHAGASAAPSRKDAAAAGSHSRPTSSLPSSRRCPHARTASPRDRCSRD